jgi:acyl carrier protein
LNTSRDPKTVSKQLCEYARVNLLAHGAQLDVDTPLSEAGLDSFALTELLLFSERTFGVTVPESHMTRDNLKSLATLAHCIVGLSGIEPNRKPARSLSP